MNTALLRSVIARSTPLIIRKRVPKFITKHLYFKGFFKVKFLKNYHLFLFSEGYILENEIYWYGIEGGHEKKSISIWMDFIKEFNPKTIYDIGANTGIYGLIAQAISQNSDVFYFEPIPKAVSILNMNLEKNCFNAEIHEVALSNYDGEGTFNIAEKDDFAYSITLNTFADLAILGTHDLSQKYRELHVKVRRISTMIDQKELPPPDLMKLDIETSEFDVLIGAGEYLNQVSALLVEVLNVESANKLNSLFSPTYYSFFNVDDNLNKITEMRTIQSSPNYNYFIIKKSIRANFSILNQNF